MKAPFNSASDKTVGEILHDLKTTGEVLRAARSKKDVLDCTIRIFLQLGFDRVRIWLVDRENETYCGAKCSYMPDEKFQKACTSLQSEILPKNYVRYLKKKKPYLNWYFSFYHVCHDFLIVLREQSTSFCDRFNSCYSCCFPNF